jgi:hypothetical protein
MFAGVRDVRHVTVTHKTKQIFATMSRRENLIIDEMVLYWEDIYQGTVMISNACIS